MFIVDIEKKKKNIKINNKKIKNFYSKKKKKKNIKVNNKKIKNFYSKK